MKTKEEILKKYANNTDHYADQEYSEDKILEAMQEFADQETTRLKKIIEKQAELIDWLEIRLNDLDSYDKYNQIHAELAALQAGEIPDDIKFDQLMIPKEILRQELMKFIKWFGHGGLGITTAQIDEYLSTK
jgi:hypothetical protein